MPYGGGVTQWVGDTADAKSRATCGGAGELTPLPVPWGQAPWKYQILPRPGCSRYFHFSPRDASNRNPGRPRSFVVLGTEMPGAAAKGEAEGKEGQQGGG